MALFGTSAFSSVSIATGALMRSKLHGLETLRAYAIFSVLLFHYQYFFAHPGWLETGFFKFGWSGVDLFFVLSGYLITSQLLAEMDARKAVSLDRFYIKRAFRILPPFGFVLALYVFVPWAREKESLPPLWKLLTFTQNIGLDVANHRTFSHAWSLCIEEQFYLLLPLGLSVIAFAKVRDRTAWTIGVLMAMGVLVRFLSFRLLVKDQPGWMAWIYYPTQTRLDGLLVGVFIAWLFHFKSSAREWLAARHFQTLLAGVALVAISYFFVLQNTPDRTTRVYVGMRSLYPSLFLFPMVSIGFGLIVVSAISPKSFLYNLRSPSLGWVATLSYSLYLSHKIVFHVAQEWLRGPGVPADGPVMMFVCLASAVGFALLMHLAIERPAFRLRDWLLARRSAGS
jgi:peptidoglycan/LPS O-acetylase OafA/YrhL